MISRGMIALETGTGGNERRGGPKPKDSSGFSTMSTDAPQPCVGSTDFQLYADSRIVIQGDDNLPPRIVEYVSTATFFSSFLISSVLA